MPTHFIGGVAMRPSEIASATTAQTLLKKESGRIIAISNMVADVTLTLPAPEDGLTYRFVYKGTAADAQNFIINTDSSLNPMSGGVVHLDTDAGAAGDEVVPVFANGATHDILTVTTPAAGTDITIFAVDTTWYITGTVVSATAPAFS